MFKKIWRNVVADFLDDITFDECELHEVCEDCPYADSGDDCAVKIVMDALRGEQDAGNQVQ